MGRAHKKKITKKNQELFTNISSIDKKNNLQNAHNLTSQKQVETPLRQVCVLLDRLPVLPDAEKGVDYRTVLDRTNLKDSLISDSDRIEDLESQVFLNKTSIAGSNSVPAIKSSYSSEISSVVTNLNVAHEINVEGIKNVDLVEGVKINYLPQTNEKIENINFATTRNYRNEIQLDRSTEKSRELTVLTNNHSSEIITSKDSGKLNMPAKPHRRGRLTNKSKDIVLQERVAKKHATAPTEQKNETVTEKIKESGNFLIQRTESKELSQTEEISKTEVEVITTSQKVDSTVVSSNKSAMDQVSNDDKTEVKVTENISTRKGKPQTNQNRRIIFQERTAKKQAISSQDINDETAALNINQVGRSIILRSGSGIVSDTRNQQTQKIKETKAKVITPSRSKVDSRTVSANKSEVDEASYSKNEVEIAGSTSNKRKRPSKNKNNKVLQETTAKKQAIPLKDNKDETVSLNIKQGGNSPILCTENAIANDAGINSKTPASVKIQETEEIRETEAKLNNPSTSKADSMVLRNKSEMDEVFNDSKNEVEIAESVSNRRRRPPKNKIKDTGLQERTAKRQAISETEHKNETAAQNIKDLGNSLILRTESKELQQTEEISKTDAELIIPASPKIDSTMVSTNKSEIYQVTNDYKTEIEVTEKVSSRTRRPSKNKNKDPVLQDRTAKKQAMSLTERKNETAPQNINPGNSLILRTESKELQQTEKSSETGVEVITPTSPKVGSTMVSSNKSKIVQVSNNYKTEIEVTENVSNRTRRPPKNKNKEPGLLERTAKKRPIPLTKHKNETEAQNIIETGMSPILRTENKEFQQTKEINETGAELIIPALPKVNTAMVSTSKSEIDQVSSNYKTEIEVTENVSSRTRRPSKNKNKDPVLQERTAKKQAMSLTERKNETAPQNINPGNSLILRTESKELQQTEKSSETGAEVITPTLPKVNSTMVSSNKSEIVQVSSDYKTEIEVTENVSNRTRRPSKNKNKDPVLQERTAKKQAMSLTERKNETAPQNINPGNFLILRTESKGLQQAEKSSETGAEVITPTLPKVNSTMVSSNKSKIVQVSSDYKTEIEVTENVSNRTRRPSKNKNKDPVLQERTAKKQVMSLTERKNETAPQNINPGNSLILRTESKELQQTEKSSETGAEVIIPALPKVNSTMVSSNKSEIVQVSSDYKTEIEVTENVSNRTRRPSKNKIRDPSLQKRTTKKPASSLIEHKNETIPQNIKHLRNSPIQRTESKELQQTEQISKTDAELITPASPKIDSTMVSTNKSEIDQISNDFKTEIEVTEKVSNRKRRPSKNKNKDPGVQERTAKKRAISLQNNKDETVPLNTKQVDNSLILRTENAVVSDARINSKTSPSVNLQQTEEIRETEAKVNTPTIIPKVVSTTVCSNKSEVDEVFNDYKSEIEISRNISNRRKRPSKNRNKDIVLEERTAKKQALSLQEYKDETSSLNIKKGGNSPILCTENVISRDEGINSKTSPTVKLHHQAKEICETVAKLNTPTSPEVDSTTVCSNKGEMDEVSNDAKNKIEVAENIPSEIMNIKTNSITLNNKDDETNIHLAVEMSTAINKTADKKNTVKKKYPKARRISAPSRKVIHGEIITQQKSFKSMPDLMDTNNFDIDLMDSKQTIKKPEEITSKKFIDKEELLQDFKIEAIDQIRKSVKASVKSHVSQNLFSVQNLEEGENRSKLIITPHEVRNVDEINRQPSLDQQMGKKSPSELFKGKKKIINLTKKTKSSNKSLTPTTGKCLMEKTETGYMETSNKLQLTSEKKTNVNKDEPSDRMVNANKQNPKSCKSVIPDATNLDMIKSDEVKLNESQLNQSENVLHRKESGCNPNSGEDSTSNKTLTENCNRKVNEPTITSHTSLSTVELENSFQLSNTFDSTISSNKTINKHSIDLNKKKEEVLIVENPDVSQTIANNHTSKISKLPSVILSPADQKAVVSSTNTQQIEEDSSTSTSAVVVPYLSSSEIHSSAIISKNVNTVDREKNPDLNTQSDKVLPNDEDNAFKIPNKTAPKARKFSVSLKSGTFLKPKLNEWNKFSLRSKINLQKRETLLKYRLLREKILEKKLSAIKFKNSNIGLSDISKNRLSNYKAILISQNKHLFENPNAKSFLRSNVAKSKIPIETVCNSQQTNQSNKFETNQTLELKSPSLDISVNSMNTEPKINNKLHLTQGSSSDDCGELYKKVSNKDVELNADERDLSKDHNEVKSTNNNKDTNGTEESVERKEVSFGKQSWLKESEIATCDINEVRDNHTLLSENPNTKSPTFKIVEQRKEPSLEDSIVSIDRKQSEKIVTSLSDFKNIKGTSLTSANKVLSEPCSSSQIKTNNPHCKLDCRIGLKNTIDNRISGNKILNRYLPPEVSKSSQNVLPEQKITAELREVSDNFITSEVNLQSTTNDSISQNTDENVDCPSGRLKHTCKTNLSETAHTDKRRFPLTPGEKKIYEAKKNRDNSSPSEKNIDNVELKSPKIVTVDESCVCKLQCSTINKTSPEKKNSSSPLNKLSNSSSLSLKKNSIDKISENTVIPTKLRSDLSTAEESDGELVQIDTEKNLTEKVTECVSELQKLDNTVMEALNNYKKSIDNEEVNQELASMIPKNGLSLKLHPDRPPQWFLKFITNFRKQELWRIHQTFKIHDHLIRVESAKLNAMERLYKELNGNNRTEIEDEDSD